MEGGAILEGVPGKEEVNRRKSRLEKRKGKLNGSGNSDFAIQMKGSSLVM